MQIELQWVELILQAWKKNPYASRQDISQSLGSVDADAADRPFSRGEIERMLAFVRQHAPSHFARIFPDEAELRSLLEQAGRL